MTYNIGRIVSKMKKEEFLKRVSSIDPEAGFKLHNIITKATRCKKYAKKIGFSNPLPNVSCAKKGLIKLFIWKYSSEGTTYWSNLYDKLWDSNL